MGITSTIQGRAREVLEENFRQQSIREKGKQNNMRERGDKQQQKHPQRGVRFSKTRMEGSSLERRGKSSCEVRGLRSGWVMPRTKLAEAQVLLVIA